MNSRLHEIRNDQGFTMVELLLTSVLLAVVVAGVGSVMVSDMKSTMGVLGSTDRLDTFGNVRSQMQQEIAEAHELSTEADNLPTGCTLSSPLVLIGVGNDNNARIAYGLRTQGPDANWQGPVQLVRCGPPYGTAGELDTAAGNLQSVLADRLPASGGFSPTVIGTGDNRDVEISLTLLTNSSASSMSRSFRARAEINMARLSASQTCSAANLCASTTTSQSWRQPASTASITGSTSKQDLMYFTKDLDQYTISSTCNRSTCTVTTVGASPVRTTLTNWDVLVFRDQQIRLI